MKIKITAGNDGLCSFGGKGIRGCKKFMSLRIEKMGIGRMEE